MQTMLSYHGDPAIKAKYIQRFAEHRAADAVIQGTGYENGRGCFVGCTLQRYDHSQFPVELGWPEWLAHLADMIFEGIPKVEAPQFGTDLLEAVPVGVDLKMVKHLFAIRQLERRVEALADNTEPYAREVEAALKLTIDYHKTPSESAARSAESAAWSAAESAAWSAAESAWSAAESAAESAWSAAESAAWVAAESAWSAAESAARPAAWVAARSAEFKMQRDDLFFVLRNIK